jgi:hypothetical protein
VFLRRSTPELADIGATDASRTRARLTAYSIRNLATDTPVHVV